MSFFLNFFGISFSTQTTLIQSASTMNVSDFDDVSKTDDRAYCETEAVAVENWDNYDFDFDYPSASATYSSSSSNTASIIDSYFYDIIDDLAQGSDGDTEKFGPVALPVAITADSNCPVLISHTFAVSDACVYYKPDGYVEENPKSTDKTEVSTEGEYFLPSTSSSVFDSKLLLKNQSKAFRKEKTSVNKKKKEVVSKIKLSTKGMTGVMSPVKNARSQATAKRERVKGKFKRVQTQWISATEFFEKRGGSGGITGHN